MKKLVFKIAAFLMIRIGGTIGIILLALKLSGNFDSLEPMYILIIANATMVFGVAHMQVAIWKNKYLIIGYILVPILVPFKKIELEMLKEAKDRKSEFKAKRFELKK